MLAFEDEQRLTVCGLDSLQAGHWKHVLIVDSSGIGYVTRDAEQCGWGTPFWGFSLLRKRAVRIRFVFDREGFSVPLEELKLRVCEAVRKQRYFTSFIADVEGTVAWANGATSHREIIERFY